MKKIAAVFIWVSFTCLGCATIHSGNYAVQVNKKNPAPKSFWSKSSNKTESGLLISGQINDELSSKYFAFIDFTFENKSQDWIRIEDIKIDFGNEEINKNITFTYGKDLSVWFKSTQKRNEIRNFNREVAMGAIIGLGAGIAATSSNQDLRNIGLATATAGATALSAYEFNKAISKIEKAEIFPENHLFSEDFFVPPGLFDKKWLVINSRNHQTIGFIEDLFIEYKIDEETVERVKLHLRNKIYSTKAGWQSDLIHQN